MDNLKKAVAALTAITTIATSAMSIASTTLSASAATTSLYLTSSQLTQNETVKVSGVNVTVPSGFYRIDVNVKNNTGFKGYGLSLDLTNCNILTYGGSVVCKKNMTDCETAINGNVCSFTYANSKDKSNDGTLFSVYVKKQNNSYINLGIRDFNNGSTNIIKPNDKYSSTGIVTSNSCVIGDANGDAKVNSSDAVLIKQKGNLSVKTINANMSYYFPKIKIVRQVDVNDDGYVNSTDATQILDYYACDIANNVYKNNLEIGKRYYL